MTITDYRQPRRRRTDRLRVWLSMLGLAAAVSLAGYIPAQAATPSTYGDFSMMFTKSPARRRRARRTRRTPRFRTTGAATTATRSARRPRRR